ncbi:MAG TPA: LysM domain-containing protein, partial [Salinivirgaceae bacterium]|nr:LysM domain-containing protein [Salinivirgaceae bacterium]
MRYYSIVIIFLLSVAYCYAQEQPTGRQNRVVISGKSYIIHIVKRGETLYNISKIYDIPYDSLTAANPLVLPTSLEIGYALKIPCFEADKKTVTETKDSIPPYHIVQKGENIYRISLKYNIKPNDIYKLNPGSEVSISVGQK